MKPRAYASIKYIEDNVKQIIPVDDILEFNSDPEEAIHTFNKDSVYTVLWDDGKNEEPVPLAVQISSIKVLQNKEELEEFSKKRGVFTVLHDSVLEDYYDSQDKCKESDSDSETVPKAVHEIPRSKARNNQGKKHSDKIDIQTQNEILKIKAKKLMESDILEIGDVLNVQSQEAHGCVSPPEMSSPEKGFKINSDHINLQTKLLQVQKESLTLQKENVILKNSLEVLNERMETFRIINESLQIKLITLEKKLKELSVKENDDDFDVERQMESICGRSTPINSMSDEVFNSSSKFYLHDVRPVDDDVVGSPDLPERSVGNSFPTSSKKDTIGRKFTSGNETPKLRGKRALNFNESSITSGSLEQSKKFRVSEDDQTDSGMGDDRDHDAHSVPSSSEDSQMNLTDKEFATISRGLFNKKKNNVKECSGKRNDQHGGGSPSKREKESEYFFNFGHEESVTNSEQVTVTYLWLNKDKKILFDEWKNMLNLKDERKFIKSCLRILHTDENGLHQANLSRRCVSTEKVAYSPGGTTRRIPLTWVEHTTIDKCLTYFCKKKMKLSDDKIGAIIKTKNAIITEEINYCVKNQKKKNKQMTVE